MALDLKVETQPSTCMETESRKTELPPRRVDDIPFRCVEHPTEVVPGYYEVEGVTPYYEIHTPNSGNRGQWNSYEHFKTVQAEPSTGGTGLRLRWGYWSLPHIPEAKVVDWLLGYYQYGWNNWIVAPFGDAGRLDNGLPDYVVPRSDGGFVPQPDDLEGLITRALRSMLPNIKAELSLVNSIIELKDFRAPIKRALSLIRSPGYGSWWSKMLKKAKRANPTFRDVLRFGASNYLQVQFNVLPLISDIRGILAAMSRTERRINDLVTRSGRVQNKHWMFTWQEHPDKYEVSGSGQWATYATGFQLVNSERWVKPEPTVFHAQIQYNYCYTDYQVEHARLLAHLDALGVNMNPAIIWNAIPWSFVVDWVAGVSRWLDSFKVENMKPKINIHRFCWSVKRQRMISVLKGISSDSSGGSLDRNMLPRVFQTAYRRSVGFPSASSIRLSGVSQDEITLGAALVLARKRRYHRGR